MIRAKFTAIAAAAFLVATGCAGQPRDLDLTAALQEIGLSVADSDQEIVVRLPNFFFEFDSANLTKPARNILRQMAGLLTEAKLNRHTISVEGHTDSLGSRPYNQKLSTKRAQAVAQELIFAQVDAGLIRATGYGETRPIAPNVNPDGSDHPDGRAQNRRVEVVIAKLQE